MLRAKGLDQGVFRSLLIATEATSFCDWHLLEFLSQSCTLAPYSPKIFRFNPKWVKSCEESTHYLAFKEIDSPKDKANPIDAISIAERLRFRQPRHLFNANMNYIPLQRLTRFRTHLAQQIASEKNYFLSHLFLKFSAYKQVSPFSDNFGATSQAMIEEFFSVEELAETPIEDLLNFAIKHSKNRFSQPEEVVKKLQQVARESYRIRPQLAESVNIVLTTTLNNIRALTKSLREVNDAIEKAYRDFFLINSSVFLLLKLFS